MKGECEVCAGPRDDAIDHDQKDEWRIEGEQSEPTCPSLEQEEEDDCHGIRGSASVVVRYTVIKIGPRQVSGSIPHVAPTMICASNLPLDRNEHSTSRYMM